MPVSNSLNDFSHLPTVDDTASASRAPKPATPAAGTPVRLGPNREKTARAAPNAPAPAQALARDHANWADLLDVEPDPTHFELPVRQRTPKPKDLDLSPETQDAALAVTPEARPQSASTEPEVVAARTMMPTADDGGAGKADEASPREDPRAASEPAADASAEAGSDEAPSAAASGKSAPIQVEEEPLTKGSWRYGWEKLGGSALTLSIAVHLFLLAGAAFLVVRHVVEPQVDFLPGGGTAQGEAASRELEHKIQTKKSPWLKRALPLQRLAARGSISDVVLPDEVPDLLDLPNANDLLSGKLGGGLGLGSGGAGGGFGKGMGLGSKSGMVFQPLSMFGREIKAKKLALVLDVSASMAPHLPRVIEEVDRVAKGSVVVLYYGCGLESPPPGRALDGDEVYRTSGPEFERYWRMGGATLDEARRFKFTARDPIPNEAIYRMLARRPQTFFIHQVGRNYTGYTWLALLCGEVRSADALYWFADFQDNVNFRQLSVVRENLQNRNQKLYIHAYQRGSGFDLIQSQLVEPTGGDVIEEEN